MKVFIINMARSKKYNVYFIYGILIVFLFWYLGSTLLNNSIVLPKINEVIIDLYKLMLRFDTYQIIFKTLTRLIITVIICFLSAILLSSIAIMYIRIEYILKPILILIKTTPIAAVIILLLMAFGQELSPYIITTLVVFPILYEGIFRSIKVIDSTIVDEIKLNSNINFKIITNVYIPIITPYLITSLIQSIGLGLKVMVMAEVIAQPKGTIGYQISQERIYLNTSNIIAWTFILIIFVVIIEYILKKIKIMIQ